MDKETCIFISLLVSVLSILISSVIFFTFIFTFLIVKNFIPVLLPIVNQENLIFLCFFLMFSLIQYIYGTYIYMIRWERDSKKEKIRISVIFLLLSLVLPFLISFFYIKNIYPVFEQFFITGNPNWIVYFTILFINFIILSINLVILDYEDSIYKIMYIFEIFPLIIFGSVLSCIPLIIHYFISKSVPYFSPLCLNCSTGVINWYSLISLFFIYLILSPPFFVLYSLLSNLYEDRIIPIFEPLNFFCIKTFRGKYFAKEDIERELLIVIRKIIKKSKHNSDILKDSNLFKNELKKISKKSNLVNFLDKEVNYDSFSFPESYEKYIDCIDDEILNLYFNSNENINYRLDLVKAIFEANRQKTEKFVDNLFIDHIMNIFYKILKLDKINNPSIKYVNVKLNNKVFEKLCKIGFIKTSDKFAIDSIVIPKIFKFKNKYYKITKIGKKFFKDCTNLKRVIIPESVRKIGKYAFKNCKNLKTVVFPKKLTEIGVGAFENCFSLFYDTSNNFTKKYTFYFPAKIGKYAFKNCKNIKSILIEEGINKIEKGTFENCYSLDFIYIKQIKNTLDWPKEIDDYAFKNCKLLTLHFSDFNKIEFIGKKAFYGCSSLEKIELKNILQIGDKAFANCSSLKELHISSEVDKIGDYAFKNCKSLNKIIIPNKVKNIGKNIFQHSFKYSNDFTYDGIFDTNIFGAKNNIKEINVKLNSYLLEKLYKQEPFRFKFSDDNINKPFNEIKQKLISVEVPGSFIYDGVKNNIKEIEISGLNSLESLQTIILPNTITEINDFTFKGCKSLTDIVIPDSVTKLGNGVFRDCKKLKNIILSNNLTEKHRNAPKFIYGDIRCI